MSHLRKPVWPVWSTAITIYQESPGVVFVEDFQNPRSKCVCPILSCSKKRILWSGCVGRLKLNQRISFAKKQNAANQCSSPWICLMICLLECILTSSSMNGWTWEHMLSNHTKRWLISDCFNPATAFWPSKSESCGLYCPCHHPCPDAAEWDLTLLKVPQVG